MTRILADLPEEDIDKLDAIAAREKRSRASALREAVKHYLVHKSESKAWIARGAGYWKDRADIGDGIEYQRSLRDDRASNSER